MREPGRLTLAAALAAACLLLACGAARPTGAPPPPPPDAAVDATPRPTADDCARSIDHLLRLRGRVDPIPEAERATLLESCVTWSTAAEVACILASPDLNALSLCDQNPPRETP